MASVSHSQHTRVLQLSAILLTHSDSSANIVHLFVERLLRHGYPTLRLLLPQQGLRVDTDALQGLAQLRPRSVSGPLA